MKLILARHGNTFEADQEPLMIGSNNDLPLVSKGRDQAKELGNVIKQIAPNLSAVFSGPLSRTVETTKIIVQSAELKLTVRVEPCLSELNYGMWEGLSTAEIQKRYGASELRAWNEQSVWPKKAGFIPAETEVISSIKLFANKLLSEFSPTDTILVVSSNGKLRYFLELIEGEFSRRKKNGSFKMRTGAGALLEHSEKGWQLAWWNLFPNEIPLERVTK